MAGKIDIKYQTFVTNARQKKKGLFLHYAMYLSLLLL